MTVFLLPVPTHSVGTDLITVQYDRAMIPILMGLLNTHGKYWAFDPSTGNPVDGESYVDTLATQLLQEVSNSMVNVLTIDPVILEVVNGNPLLRGWSLSPAQPTQYWAYQVGGAAQLDRWESSFWLDAGTYEVIIPHFTGPAYGYMYFLYDSQVRATKDNYSSSYVANNILRASFTVGSSGFHNIGFSVPTKNSSSSGYYIGLGMITIRRTSS